MFLANHSVYTYLVCRFVEENNSKMLHYYEYCCHAPNFPDIYISIFDDSGEKTGHISVHYI